ncbi:MAG: hypothetical protein FJ029_14990, partial [Actinobacteria bacterium]|nr:hypothetical protein [Actinomycetota bacterium]
MGSRSSLALGPAELETAGRFILGDLPVRIEAGSWWAYRPAEGTVTYPSALLAEWAPERVIAALCHEAAEARFTGEDGARLVADWIERMRSRGLSDATLALLVNTVNDFRVNRLHMRRYPGTRGLFRHLYAAGAALESRTDVRRSLADGGGAPLHHQFLDGALYAWTEREWPGLSPPPDLDERPRRALGLVRGAVLRAAEHDRVADLLASLEVHILPAYAQLVADEMAAQAAGAVRASTAPETTDPGQSLADDGGSGAGAGPAATPAGRADLKIGPPGTAPSTGAPEHPGEPPAPAAASVGAGQPGRQSPPRAGLP